MKAPFFHALFGLIVAVTSVLAEEISFAATSNPSIKLELQSPARISAGSSEVVFRLRNLADNSFVTDKDLSVQHEKLLHFLAYDPGLKEFRHVHPEFDGQFWRTTINFAVNGNYFVWAQGTLSAGSKEFNISERIEVQNGLPAWPAPVLTDVRQGNDSGSVATLSPSNVRAGKMAMLDVTLTREDGSPAEITPYLGAFAHVVATPQDGASLTHVHPMDGDAPNVGMLHMTFPKSGYYRLWIQFLDAGVLKTVPLSIKVN